MLTEKEIEVLTLRKRGWTQNKIAKKLKITQPAVSCFYNNALKKIKDAGEIIHFKKQLKIGQGAIEFMIILGVALFFFIFIFASIQGNISDKNADKRKILLQSVALNVRDEVNLAAGASEGYYREFRIPTNILGVEYTLNITETFVLISMNRISFSYKVSSVIGDVQKGTNNITKQNGQVYLNQ